MQRIIIAEDDNLLAELIEARLAGSFDVVAKVSDGMELIKKFGELKPDMIITDIEMPEMNGLEAAEAIKEKYPSTKIVVITAPSNPITNAKGIPQSNGTIRSLRI